MGTIQMKGMGHICVHRIRLPLYQDPSHIKQREDSECVGSCPLFAEAQNRNGGCVAVIVHVTMKRVFCGRLSVTVPLENPEGFLPNSEHMFGKVYLKLSLNSGAT